MTKVRCDYCNSLLITGDCKNGKYKCATCKQTGSLYNDFLKRKEEKVNV